MKCQWYGSIYKIEETCDNEAEFTTCDPINGVVCAKHKCRCSKLISKNDVDNKHKVIC